MVRDRQTDISEGRGGETVGADCCVVLPRLCFLQEILGWPRGEGLKCAEHAVPTGAGSSRGCGAEDQGIDFFLEIGKCPNLGQMRCDKKCAENLNFFAFLRAFMEVTLTFSERCHVWTFEVKPTCRERQSLENAKKQPETPLSFA